MGVAPLAVAPVPRPDVPGCVIVAPMWSKRNNHQRSLTFSLAFSSSWAGGPGREVGRQLRGPLQLDGQVGEREGLAQALTPEVDGPGGHLVVEESGDEHDREAIGPPIASDPAKEPPAVLAR